MASSKDPKHYKTNQILVPNVLSESLRISHTYQSCGLSKAIGTALSGKSLCNVFSDSPGALGVLTSHLWMFSMDHVCKREPQVSELSQNKKNMV